ncbi:MAG TPA: alpha-amylase family glycosyl hydrolase, partial [Albitalea sp.]|nr:alpha-amylase family glycosyl hydrolase [Albitalea sp.]
LDLGVDGYRLDTANFYMHDEQLRDNPPRNPAIKSHVSMANPYAWQWHKHSKNHPDNLRFLRRLRALLDEYPHTTMVGEIGDDEGLRLMAEYTRGGDKLHMAYSFDLLSAEHDAPHLHKLIAEFNRIVDDGWGCWAIANHDVTRVATRWGGAQPEERLLRLAAALQVSVRGSPCLYQGDELGLTEASLAFEDLQDPYGIAMWPEVKGRDGCRTPMPWRADAPHGGFTAGPRAWLPLASEHRARAVDQQEGRADSTLAFYRRLLHWRRGHPALVKGTIELLPTHPQVLAFLREHQGERMLCAFNFSERPASWPLPAGMSGARVDEGSGLQGAQLRQDLIHFEPWGGLFTTV